MIASYAEICRTGNLETDFQQVPFVHFFFFFFSSQYCWETSIIQIQQRKKKRYFLRQKIPKQNHFTIEIA